MAKKIGKDVVDERFVDISTYVHEPELTSTALSIVKTGDKVYAVVSVKFNLGTLESGNIKVLHKDLDLYEAQYQFKMETIHAGIF